MLHESPVLAQALITVLQPGRTETASNSTLPVELDFNPAPLVSVSGRVLVNRCEVSAAFHDMDGLVCVQLFEGLHSAGWPDDGELLHDGTVAQSAV